MVGKRTGALTSRGYHHHCQDFHATGSLCASGRGSCSQPKNAMFSTTQRRTAANQSRRRFCSRRTADDSLDAPCATNGVPECSDVSWAAITRDHETTAPAVLKLFLAILIRIVVSANPFTTAPLFSVLLRVCEFRVTLLPPPQNYLPSARPLAHTRPQ
jgi:hypothetical protein